MFDNENIVKHLKREINIRDYNISDLNGKFKRFVISYNTILEGNANYREIISSLKKENNLLKL